MVDLFSQLLGSEEVTDVVEKARREVRYLVTDFTFEIMVNKFREEAEAEGDIYVPEYQRKLAWHDSQQSYLIESFILRYPIPPIFFYDINGRLEIVDGTQRIRTMVRFARDQLILEGLEKLDILNGFMFSQLPPAVQGRLNNTPIRAFVLDDTTDPSTRADLFRRLNTSGKKLEDSEIRRGVFKGPLMDLIIDRASSTVFKEAAPRVHTRQDLSAREELVTRFFVYLDHYKEFTHDVRKFLDQHVIIYNNTVNDVELVKMNDEFDNAMGFISRYMPKGFYRTNRPKQVPRVRFEAVAVGTALALRERPNLVPGDTSWLSSDDFNELVRTDASNSGPKLRRRIEFVRNKLLGSE